MSKLAIKGGKKIVNRKYQLFIHPKLNSRFLKKMYDKTFQSQVSSFDGEGLINQLQLLFEKKFHVKHALAMNSGTSALFSMFYAVGLEPGDEVIVPVYTFFATATPLFILGCKPVLVDSLANGNINPDDIRKKITRKTRTIVITHMWGIPCDMDEIMDIAEKYKLPVLEDTSHAHGATYKGKVAGTFGLCSAWSLGAKKLITGGQGGMLGTADEEVYQRAILVGQANNKIIKEVTLENLKPYFVTGTGLNLRMHPFSAALIYDQIKNYEKQLRERREVAAYLIKEISQIPGLSLPRIPKNSSPSWYAFPILFNQEYFDEISKDLFVKALNTEGAAGFDIPHSTCPLTEFPIFREAKFNFKRLHNLKEIYRKEEFIVAETFHKSLFKLPTWYGPERMNYAKAHIEALRKVIANIRELKN